MAGNQYLHQGRHAAETPPRIAVRYFYTSPLAIDDPLSPLPPPPTGASIGRRVPPRPFSAHDNDAINEAWHELRRTILKHHEAPREKDGAPLSSQARDIPPTSMPSRGQHARSAELASPLEPTTTGTPFIRAPSRGQTVREWQPASMEGGSRPFMSGQDSYRWDDDMEPALSGSKDKQPLRNSAKEKPGPSAKVPVGVSRLHHVVMDAEAICMEPIYWSPLSDVAQIVRGTWFYKDTMMPVEVQVAIMLEAGYLEMQPWTQTWKDELNSAIDVGAVGEVKILHNLWPEKRAKPESRPSTSQQMQTTGLVQNTLPEDQDDPDKERRDTVANACDLIDFSTGPEGPDHKAAGDLEYGADGRKRSYLKAGIIYANETEAYILKPTLQPSHYYGRRPLANYIRKGRAIGVQVVRGFDQASWDKLHAIKDSAKIPAARESISVAQAGASQYTGQKSDPNLAQAERPKVTDLVLVVHGIGQKLSERMETFHFTHAMNAFRREMNVELETPHVKRHIRKNMGGIMCLPVSRSLESISRSSNMLRSTGAIACHSSSMQMTIQTPKTRRRTSTLLKTSRPILSPRFEASLATLCSTFPTIFHPSTTPR